MSGSDDERAQHTQNHHRPHPLFVGDPEERPSIEEDIAQCSPAKRREKRHHDHADKIEPLLSGDQDSRDREGQNTHALENHEKLTKCCLIERYIHQPSVPEKGLALLIANATSID